MLDLQIIAGGMDTPHKRGYCFENKNGSDHWLLLRFHTPFFAELHGERTEGKIGGCLIHPSHTPLVHGSTEDMTKGFVNDWLWFGGEDAAALVNKLELPVNEIFYPGEIAAINKQTSLVISEWKRMLPESQLMQGLHMAQLLVELKRGLVLSGTDDTSFQVLSEVRSKMLENVGERWTLKQMAGLSGYSVSRFTMLYRQYFDSSPTADLIRARIAMARSLLLSGTQSISSISEICGFSSVQYFTRTYRAITGESPSETRRGKI